MEGFAGKRVLVIHQQVLANEVRDRILSRSDAQMTVACWFEIDPAIGHGDEVALGEESDFTKMVEDGNFDVVIGDAMLKQAIPGFTGEFIDLPHFAVSGRAVE